MIFNHTTQNLHVLLDCDPSNIYQGVVDPDKLEISSMQNMVEWLYPNDIEIQLGNKEYMIELADTLNYPLAREVVEHILSL